MYPPGWGERLIGVDRATGAWGNTNRLEPTPRKARGGGVGPCRNATSNKVSYFRPLVTRGTDGAVHAALLRQPRHGLARPAGCGRARAQQSAETARRHRPNGPY